MTAGSDGNPPGPPPVPAPWPADAAAAAAPPAPPSSGPPANDAEVLARGHLHPSILLLHLLEALRRSAFPIAIGVFWPNWPLVGIGAVLFLLHLGYAVARYLTLHYTLTRDELRIREGLLERQERRIPLDRIQDLGFESSILRRVLGLAVVLVETASGRGVEARLDALSRADAEHLREVLLAARADAARAVTTATPTAGAGDDGLGADPSAPPAPPPAPEPEWLVHRSSVSDLLARGVTDLRLSAFFATGFAALEFARQFGIPLAAGDLLGKAFGWLGQYPALVVAAVFALLVLVVLAVGIGSAMVGNLFTFHGFRLTLRGDVLQRRFGLLTTRQKTLPRERVQRVTVEQTWLRRLLGYGVVKADSAGGSRSDGQDVTGGWDVVVPLARLPVIDAMLAAVLPGIERAQFAWRQGSRRLIGRTAVQGVILAAIATPLAWWRYGPVAMFVLLLVPLWALLGVLIWRNLGWALDGDFLALQHGILGRNIAYVPTAKVQAVVVRRGPIAQLFGLADLTVYVAGGSPTRIPDLTAADARELAQEVAQRAAIAAAATWTGSRRGAAPLPAPAPTPASAPATEPPPA